MNPESGETLSVQQAPQTKRFRVTVNGAQAQFIVDAEHANDILHLLQDSASTGNRVVTSSPPTWIVNHGAIATLQIDAV